MENVLNVAQFIIDEYEKMTGNTEKIDEMKLHKLLYLSQRECLAILGEPLFKENFEGWRYGPVCREVRTYFTKDGLQCNTSEISNEAAYIVRSILEQYGCIESWKLSELTHNEISWKNAREGLKPSQNGDKVLLLDDIRKDAEKIRPYDTVWDMYYDEFEDADEGVREA